MSLSMPAQSGLAHWRDPSDSMVIEAVFTAFPLLPLTFKLRKSMQTKFPLRSSLCLQEKVETPRFVHDVHMVYGTTMHGMQLSHLDINSYREVAEIILQTFVVKEVAAKLLLFAVHTWAVWQCWQHPANLATYTISLAHDKGNECRGLNPMPLVVNLLCSPYVQAALQIDTSSKGMYQVPSTSVWNAMYM